MCVKIVCNTYEFDKKCGININDIDGIYRQQHKLHDGRTVWWR